ncbi:MAG: hypothetical protein R3B93_16905 [Bacteroidia bacterium]
MKFEAVINYLRKYSSEEPPYDANGAIHLLKAIIQNLRENFNDSDFEDYAANLDEKDEEFLHKLIQVIPRSRANWLSENE